MDEMLVNGEVWRLILAQGVPAAVLLILTLWIILRGAPLTLALIERIFARQAELLERHGELIAAQHEELRELALLARHQGELLQSLESGLALLLSKQECASAHSAGTVEAQEGGLVRLGRRVRGRA